VFKVNQEVGEIEAVMESQESQADQGTEGTEVLMASLEMLEHLALTGRCSQGFVCQALLAPRVTEGSEVWMGPQDLRAIQASLGPQEVLVSLEDLGLMDRQEGWVNLVNLDCQVCLD